MKLIFDFSIFPILKITKHIKRASIKKTSRWEMKIEKEEETNFLALFQFENHNHFEKLYRKTANKFSLENSIQFLLQNNIITVFLILFLWKFEDGKLKITAQKVETFKIIETSSPNSTMKIFSTLNPIFISFGRFCEEA